MMTRLSLINFDRQGVRNYCAVYDDPAEKHPTGEVGDRALQASANICVFTEIDRG